MVLRKLKDVLAEKHLAKKESKAKDLGFASIEELDEFKKKHRNEVKAKVNKEKISKKRQKLKDKITYNETTSPTKKVLDIYEKGFKIMDKVSDGINQVNDAIDDFGTSMNDFGTSMNGFGTSKTTKRKTKPKKRNSSETIKFPNANFKF